MTLKASDFELGDLVQHLSGGPKMAVSGLDHLNDRVYTEWFGSDSERKNDGFWAYMLKFADK